jgi:D-glycero-D-manno-heptose 1,7-bisphosphate phosphatase
VVTAIFLDRDGVLNANLARDGKPVAPTRLEEFRLLPGVESAVHQLKDAGFFLVVVTNQPDVATGRTTKTVVESMHQELRRRMPLDDIRVCYHTDADNCRCRKPKPGMLLDAAAEHGIDVGKSYLVGDRWRDIEAGGQAGCMTIFIDYGYVQEHPFRPDKTVASLVEATKFILDRERQMDSPQ